MANDDFGPKRLVVGAHYGMRDWLAQRITGVVMAVYTVLFVITLFVLAKAQSEGLDRPMSDLELYKLWAGMFAMQWFKTATFITLMALFYHVWVGVRDIWMDYVKSVAVRLVFQCATILWLVGCAGYAAQILWRV
jgi:succinate dehydrogenase / fumarate reductase membrane anchor subunit